jgi:hypothetical protein
MSGHSLREWRNCHPWAPHSEDRSQALTEHDVFCDWTPEGDQKDG